MMRKWCSAPSQGRETLRTKSEGKNTHGWSILQPGVGRRVKVVDLKRGPGRYYGRPDISLLSSRDRIPFPVSAKQ